MDALEKIADDYAREVEVDYVCLAQIPFAVKRDMHITAKADIQAKTLEVVKKLLERGLRPGDYLRTGFVHWKERTTDAIISRIRLEWPLNHDVPTLEEPICWFAPPRRLH